VRADHGCVSRQCHDRQARQKAPLGLCASAPRAGRDVGNGCVVHEPAEHLFDSLDLGEEVSTFVAFHRLAPVGCPRCTKMERQRGPRGRHHRSVMARQRPRSRCDARSVGRSGWRSACGSTRELQRNARVRRDLVRWREPWFVVNSPSRTFQRRTGITDGVSVSVRQRTYGVTRNCNGA